MRVANPRVWAVWMVMGELLNTAHRVSSRSWISPVQLIVYPGVGRGFDFRPPNVRTFADDLASKDSLQRAAEFMRRHLR